MDSSGMHQVDEVRTPAKATSKSAAGGGSYRGNCRVKRTEQKWRGTRRGFAVADRSNGTESCIRGGRRGKLPRSVPKNREEDGEASSSRLGGAHSTDVGSAGESKVSLTLPPPSPPTRSDLGQIDPSCLENF